MRLALPPRAMRRPGPRATPQPRGQHPPAQRVVMHRDPVFARQMLRGQRRPKPRVDRPAVLLPHERQHLRALGRGPRMIRRATRAPMLQSLRPFRSIPPRQTLRLAIAHGQQRRRRSQTQGPRLHAAQHLHPRQLPRTHPCPSQPMTPFEVISLEGTFLFRSRGDIIDSRQQHVPHVRFVDHRPLGGGERDRRADRR